MIESSRADCNNYPASRFNFLVNWRKPGCADGTDSPFGGKYPGGLQKKAQKVSGAWITKQIQPMACYLIEVGCWGFAGRSLCRTLSWLGMIGEKRGRPLEWFQNRLKKLWDGYGLKDQSHGAWWRLVNVGVLNLKEKREIERGGKKEGIKKKSRKEKKWREGWKANKI